MSDCDFTERASLELFVTPEAFFKLYQKKMVNEISGNARQLRTWMKRDTAYRYSIFDSCSSEINSSIFQFFNVFSASKSLILPVHSTNCSQRCLQLKQIRPDASRLQRHQMVWRYCDTWLLEAMDKVWLDARHYRGNVGRHCGNSVGCQWKQKRSGSVSWHGFSVASWIRRCKWKNKLRLSSRLQT
jgi:hypothetical protein